MTYMNVFYRVFKQVFFYEFSNFSIAFDACMCLYFEYAGQKLV
jgi:hypothetical protein